MAEQLYPRYPLEERRKQVVSWEASIPQDSIDPRLLSLAMGFVPRQLWENPYNHETALSHGTIFPALDKPFLGWQMQKGAMK